MSKIEYCFKDPTILYVDYKNILEKKIRKVCNKIGFNDSMISWYIFNPDEQNEQKSFIFAQIRKGYSGKDYGYCYTNKKQIWISTLSIIRDNDVLLFNKIPNILKQSCMTKRDFLADVIIDEITHIQTGCNHGSKEYDTKFRENMEKYYISPIERAILNKGTHRMGVINRNLIPGARFEMCKISHYIGEAF